MPGPTPTYAAGRWRLGFEAQGWITAEGSVDVSEEGPCRSVRLVMRPLSEATPGGAEGPHTIYSWLEKGNALLAQGHPTEARAEYEAAWRAIDVETVMQETLLRMWAFACDAERVLEGENASLRFAHGIAYNLARNMARKHGKLKFFPPEELDVSMPDDHTEPPSDPFLMQHIKDCVAALSDKLRGVLSARLERAHAQEDDARRVARGRPPARPRAGARARAR